MTEQCGDGYGYMAYLDVRYQGTDKIHRVDLGGWGADTLEEVHEYAHERVAEVVRTLRAGRRYTYPWGATSYDNDPPYDLTSLVAEMWVAGIDDNDNMVDLDDNLTYWTFTADTAGTITVRPGRQDEQFDLDGWMP